MAIKLCFKLVALIFLLSACGQASYGTSLQEMKDKLPDNATIEKIAKDSMSTSYLDSLHTAVSDFKDYKVLCHLLSLKDNEWKDYGGATLFFKKDEKIRAEIISSDYRNGSVVVKQSDGKIRGKGGGGLSLIKMTIQPDSRSIRLPTGFSLAKSDFISLYGTLKQQLADGAEAYVSPPTTLPAFREPVQVLIFKKKGEGLAHVVYVNPKTKSPVLWNTYDKGQSHAIVLFEKLDINPGLPDDLFRL